jgi:hypothetical protein
MRMPTVTIAIAASLTTACAKHIPQPTGVTPGTPRISWVIMSGDRDNPDQDFVCQSDPRSVCVVPASRPDAQTFSHVHVYYHGAGAETKYTGSIDIGFFQGDPAARTIQANMAVAKADDVKTQSVTGIVTSTPGRYAVKFEVGAVVTDTKVTRPIREQIPIAVQ